MAKTVSSFLAELLREYETQTRKTYTEMALDFDITLSNLYQYRNGSGNPTARTIDKIVTGIETYCPEVLRKLHNYEH